MFCVVQIFRVRYSIVVNVFFFKQKTAYEMRISDWSSDVCSSDLQVRCDEGATSCRLQGATVEVEGHRAAVTAGIAKTGRSQGTPAEVQDGGAADRKSVV